MVQLERVSPAFGSWSRAMRWPRRVMADLPIFDGVAELWFDDLAAMLQARQSVEWAASTADEVNFVDPARSAYLISEERQIV